MGCYIFCLFGTGGDLYPCVPVAKHLAERGHRVTVAANQHFQGLFDSPDIEFVSIGAQADYLRAVEDPRHWAGRGILWTLQAYLGAAIEPVFRLIESRRGERPVVVATGNAFGARFAEQVLGVCLYTVVYAPAFLISEGRFPYPYNRGWWSRMPTWAHRTIMRLTDWMADRQLVPALNIWRRDLGLAPLSRYIPSTKRRAVAFFPAWFDDLAAMAASEVLQGDFVYHHASETGQLPGRIEQFLCHGTPTVVVTFGTGVAHVRERFEKLVDAFSGHPLRAIFLTRFDANKPRNAAEHVLVESGADLAVLLPRCALLVHHGGIGTVAQAMRAGVPQLVIPITYDQPDNGFRVRALGLGDLLEGEWDSASVRSRIESVIANADHVKLREIRDRIISRDGTGCIADILERVAVVH